MERCLREFLLPQLPEEDIANDDLGDKFPEFCADFCHTIKNATKPGAHIYIGDGRQRVACHRRRVAEGRLSLVRARSSGPRTRSSSEEAIITVNSSPFGTACYDAPRLHPLEDRNKSDLWFIDRPKRSEEHPTMKPCELVTRALLNSSR